MTVDFIGSSWECTKSEDAKCDVYEIGGGGYLYMFTTVVGGDRKILYIGASVSLYSRVAGHPIIKLFKENKVADKVEFLYRKADKYPYDEEKRLILKHDPPINLTFKKFRGYQVEDMWRDLGVNKPKSEKLYYRRVHKCHLKESEKVGIVKLTAKKKHHKAIILEFQSKIQEYERSLDKEIKQ